MNTGKLNPMLVTGNRVSNVYGASDSRNSLDPITREVYELADAGHAPVEIARKLGQHTGKVELILALREG